MAEVAATTDGGRAVTLRFEKAEYEARLARARADMARQGLSALLLFAQESHYYLTGFDSGGYVFYQCGVVAADGRLVLLTRRPDLAQARDTSLYDDIRIWYDAEDQDPAGELRGILAELGLHGARVGIELATYGLTGASHQATRDALDGFCTLVDASGLVRALRLRKSPAEIAFVRRAAALADDAIEAMVAAAGAGRLDSAITAAGVAAMLGGGGDMPPAGPLVNSGRRAVYGRGVGGPRRLDAQDQVMLELAASFGYSLGATFRPSWMDVPPMIHAGNRQELRPGMVLFPHVMLGDMEAGTAAGVGWTILVGERGAEVLSRLPLELHRR